MKQLSQEIDVFLPLLKSITRGKCAIALAGAHAKGLADDISDIDFHVFLDAPKSHSEITELFMDIADEGTLFVTEDFSGSAFGGIVSFFYKGNEVGVIVQLYSFISIRIEDCLAGKFEIIPQQWTTNGFFTYVSLGEVYHMKPLYDPNGFLAQLKEKIIIYPEKLRNAIIEEFRWRAGMWLHNFHYNTAIKRGDIFYTAPIVLHTLLDMVQIIFAINRVYFCGDKKYVKQLSAMEYCPPELLTNLQFLLTASSKVSDLQKQCDILRIILKDIDGKINFG